METIDNRIKIGLLLEGRGLEKVNMMNPENGNPGMGGTQYCILLLAYYLNRYYSDVFDVSIISYVDLIIPETIGSCKIQSFDQLNRKTYDIILLYTPQDLTIYQEIKKLDKIKFITWSHNFLLANTVKAIMKTSNISCNVFVGKQMYDFYIDDDIINKSVFIYNIVPDPLKEQIIRHLPSNPTLTYMGNLIKEKGFISLLRIWNIVVKEYPKARLNIIGKGNLYNRNKKLGKLGIVDDETEKLIKPLICDNEGKIDSRIKFWGILGSEKYEVFLNSTVGIVNPTSRTETFGLGVVEMACSKLPVVTKNWNGHPDTVLNGKTGLLGLTEKEIADKICALIEDVNLNFKLGEEAKRQVNRFSPDIIMPQWKKLLIECYTNNFHPRILGISHPYWNNYKFLRKLNSFFRNNCHLSFLPSIVEYETCVYNKLAWLKSKIRK